MVRVVTAAAALAHPHLVRDPHYGAFWRATYASALMALVLLGVLVERFAPLAFRFAAGLLILLALLAVVRGAWAWILFALASPFLALGLVGGALAVPEWAIVMLSLILPIPLFFRLLPHAIETERGTLVFTCGVAPAAAFVMTLNLVHLGAGRYFLEGIPPPGSLAVSMGLALTLAAPACVYVVVDRLRFGLGRSRLVPLRTLAVAGALIPGLVLASLRAMWWFKPTKRMESFRGATAEVAIDEIAAILREAGLATRTRKIGELAFAIQARSQDQRIIAEIAADYDEPFASALILGDSKLAHTVSDIIRRGEGSLFVLSCYSEDGRDLERDIADAAIDTRHASSKEGFPAVPDEDFEDLPMPDQLVLRAKLERLTSLIERRREALSTRVLPVIDGPSDAQHAVDAPSP